MLDEFTFPITVKVGKTKQGSTKFTVGSEELNFNLSIYQEDIDRYRVYDNIKHISDPLSSKEACVHWIINKLKGN